MKKKKKTVKKKLWVEVKDPIGGNVHLPTRQIEVPHWGHDIKRGNLSLPNLIEWCEKQTDAKHQAITAWLVAARDMMDCATMAAIKQSQIDSRKKLR